MRLIPRGRLRKRCHKLASFLLLSGLLCGGINAQPISLFYDAGARQAAFGASEIRRAYAGRGVSLIELGSESFAANSSALRLVIAAGQAESQRWVRSLGSAPMKHNGPQSYSIRRQEQGNAVTIAVLGTDPTGAMYGALDLAEAVRLGTLGDLRDSDHAPRIERRGIKFNIPLDVRTPGYSDSGDSAQQNIPEMWSLDFWHEFIDEMARNRYNVLTLWNLHPFPSIVKVPEFPGVALDDVMRTTVPLDDTFQGTARDMVRPVMLEHVETVKKITIDEKIAFWREIMQYAQDRGVEVYWFTWNIYTFGAEGKYGIDHAQSNQRTIDYFRASVRELVLTYPLLAGIGITAGEQMEDKNTEVTKEGWLWKTYGQGIMDAKKLQPGRSVRLIHRFHQTAMSEVFDAFKDYADHFEVSFKYSIAHMYSMENPPFIKPLLPYLNPKQRTWLTVRDDDIYSFRWGNPDFARAYVRNMPGPDKLVGFYLGSDGYTWGREFLSTEPETPRQLVVKKRWYSFMLWGRLSYDPDLPDALFERTIAARFPEVPAGDMLRAWAEASKIIPQMTRFFWRDIDMMWLPEANTGHPIWFTGFYTVKHYIEGRTMPESGILNIVEWRKRRLAGQPMQGITPVEVADALANSADTTLRMVAEFRAKQGTNKELRLTLGDIEAMAHLGNYYAAKIRGACGLALFDKTGKPQDREEAIAHLQSALGHWKRYASVYVTLYRQPQLYPRVGWVDIPGLASKVEQDIGIARLWTPGTVPDTLAHQSEDVPFHK